jgi:hypothetical protein
VEVLVPTIDESDALSRGLIAPRWSQMVLAWKRSKYLPCLCRHSASVRQEEESMSAKGRGDGARAIQIRAISIETLAADHPIGFPPPLAEYSGNPYAFEFNWHLIQFVFGLPDPKAFPPFTEAVAADLVTVFRRYTSAAVELAESTFLAHPTGVAVNVLDGGLEERIEKSFPPRENVRGFSVLFRQFYSNGEAASCKAVQNLLWRINEQAADDSTDTRSEYLKSWIRAAGRLRGYSLELLVSKRLEELGRIGPGPHANEHLPGPEVLISTYSYGEDIHWGKQRDQLAAYSKSEFDSAWTRMACFEAMVGLAHIYLGFAQLVDAALALQV